MVWLIGVFLFVASAMTMYGQVANGDQKEEHRLYALGLDLLEYQLHHGKKDTSIERNGRQVTSGDIFTQSGFPGDEDQRGTIELSNGNDQSSTPFLLPQKANRRVISKLPSTKHDETYKTEINNIPITLKKEATGNNFETERPRQSSQVQTTNYYRNIYEQPSNSEEAGFLMQARLNGEIGSDLSEFERGDSIYISESEKEGNLQKESNLVGDAYTRMLYELLRATLEEARYSEERRSKYSKQHEFYPQNYDEYNAQRSVTSGDQHGTYPDGTRDIQREREEYQRLRRKFENFGHTDEEFQRGNSRRVVYESDPQHVVVPVVNAQGKVINYPTHRQPERSYLSSYQRDILSRFSTLSPQFVNFISAIPRPSISNDGFDYGSVIQDQDGSKESIELYNIPNGYGSVVRKRNPDGGSHVDASQIQSSNEIKARKVSVPPKNG